ncbi:MAG: hypothetical protein QOI31_2553 [Solirubrobacterales bacterium]|jgi:hypothetical protein|nr:hypothetical protein [Solirubrobacterales bacterium]
MQPAMQPAAGIPSSRLTNRAALGIVGGLILVATLLFVVLGGGDESSDTTAETMSVAEIQQADADAQAQARTAQTAIETFATDNAGQYAGATPSALQQIESNLTAPLTVDAQATTYTLTTESETGTTFSITRDASGLTTLNCTPPGEGNCPESGDWAQ